MIMQIDYKKGLTSEQVQERIDKNLVNYDDMPKTKTIKKIIADNVFSKSSFRFSSFWGRNTK